MNNLFMDIQFDVVAACTVALILHFMVAIAQERALALIFDWRYYKTYLAGYGLKTPIAFATALGICYFYGMDFFAMAFNAPVHVLGQMVSALLIAGGSKGIVHMLARIKEGAKQMKGE